jgi:hypothetical protein
MSGGSPAAAPAPGSTDDNGRQAAAIKVSISNYVGTAALAMLAGAVALFTYIQQNFNPSVLFYVLILLSVIALVAGIVAGGKGADSTADEVAKGTWNQDTTTPAYNVQSILTLAGLVLVLAAAGVGTTLSAPPAKPDACVTLLSTQLAAPHPCLTQLRQELAVCEAAKS